MASSNHSSPASSNQSTELPPVTNTSSDAELSQAFRDLARGEQTAQALEASLTSLERKLDDLLASFDKAELQKVEGSKTEGSNAERVVEASDNS